jgi:hypothetical protein
MTVASNLWMTWSSIARDEAQAAREAHSVAVAAVAEGEQFVTGEMRHAIVGIVAAAFAVDGFYGATKKVCEVPRATRRQWKAKKTARTVRVFSTLQHGFKMSNADAKRWRKEIGWLFFLRGHAAHHKPEDLPPLYRPEFDSAFSSDSVLYTADAAERAARFAFDLIETCLRNPRPPAQQWAKERPNDADYIAEHRDALPPAP